MKNPASASRVERALQKAFLQLLTAFAARPQLDGLKFERHAVQRQVLVVRGTYAGLSRADIRALVQITESYGYALTQPQGIFCTRCGEPTAAYLITPITLERKDLHPPQDGGAGAPYAYRCRCSPDPIRLPGPEHTGWLCGTCRTHNPFPGRCCGACGARFL